MRKLRLAYWLFFWGLQLGGVGLSYMVHNWWLMGWCTVWSYYGLVKLTKVLDEIFKIVYHQP